jgi:NADPH:quinone reductase-like Zn-dependent oxidoreductase
MQLLAASQKSLSFATFSSDAVPAADRRAVRAEQFTAASHGELETVVDEVLPLEQAVLAHQKMGAGEVFGRIVLVPSS